MVDATGATSSSQSSTATTTSTASTTALNKDMFLKLLVAQLKNQDPSKPTDSDQMLAQTAQFTLVEKMEELAASQATLNATSLVGRTVSWTDGAKSGTGVVDSMLSNNGKPLLRIGQDDVPVTGVTAVLNTPVTAAPAPAATA